MNVIIPRSNMNEDQVLIADVAVTEGQHVEEGDTVCVVETTKVAVEVNAPAAGFVSKLHAGLNDVVDVGSTFCELDTEIDDSAQGQKATVPPGMPPRITAKAKKRARELGLDQELLPKDAVVDVEFVERVAQQYKASESAVTISHEVPIGDSGQCAVINGGGGHAAVVIDALRGSGARIEGAVDSIKPIGTEVLHGISVVGDEDMLGQLQAEGIKIAFVGVGGADDNLPRQKVFTNLKEKGFELPPVIHPEAYVGEGVEIGEGSLVLAGAVIGPRCRIGANVIINQGAQICHDSSIGDHSHLAPGALVAGYCKIGEHTVIGMAATILDHTCVGRNCLIHNGAAVVSGVPDGTVLTRDGQRFMREA